MQSPRKWPAPGTGFGYACSGDECGARTASGASAATATPVISVDDGSPRVFAARSAITAAHAAMMAASSSARWNPAVSATGVAAPAASSAVVRAVATAEKIASPSPAPTWVDAVTSAPASPASDGGTPALAAVCTPTNTAPSPNPGKRADSVPAAAGLMREPVERAESQFAAMGRPDARDLAVQVIARYQGTALLTSAFRDRGLMEAEARRVAQWIDTLD